MSRILRRPMFRGGRVDGRGTGIASGLGYADGGSVNTPKRGLVDGPGGYSGVSLGWNLLKAGARPAMKYGRKGLDWLLRPKGGYGTTIRGGKEGSRGVSGTSGGTMDKYISQTMPKKSISEMWKDLGTSRAGGAGQFLWKDPAVRWPLKTIGGGAKGLWSLAKKPVSVAGAGGLGYAYKDEIEDLWDEYSPWADEKAGGREFVGEEAEIVGDPRDLPTEQETLEEIIAKIKAEEEAKRQELIDIMTPKKLTKEEQLDALKEKKEMLRELYPSGRGQDASRMLMNVASKWLEPEATVKSGFGKALGEESKVESKRVKYDDAAAQGAITSFLAGETSYQKFQDDLALYADKLGIQTGAAKAVEKNKSLAKIKSESRESSTTRKNKDSAQQWLDNQEIDKFVNETNSKKVPVEELFVEENIGEYFVDQQTGDFFLITILENGEIGKVRKG